MLTGAIRQLSSKDIAELDQQHEPLLKNSSDLEKVTELLQGLHIKIKKTKENNDDQKEQQRQEQAKRGVQKAQQVWGNRTSLMGSMGSMKAAEIEEQRADIDEELSKVKSLTDKARRAVRLRAQVSIEYCRVTAGHTLGGATDSVTRASASHR